MKVSRRNFLSFIIGGAVGTNLSPLPWKLTDDISIWSQNWPWTPVPAQGEVTHVTSTCTLCPAGCGISVRKVDDRVVKIEGLKGHPINDGGICILGVSGPQLLYGPSRVRTPLKRQGERGQGRWTRISWDQAIAEVAEGLMNLRDQDRPHALAAVVGTGRGTVDALVERWVTAFGSPNFIRTPSVHDSYEMAALRMSGHNGPVGFDVEQTDFLLSFGAGILDGWDSPVRMFRANSLRRDNGGKLVQVESRQSNTAVKADHWVPVNPGTEAILAMGIAGVLVAESLYDKRFVLGRTEGFQSLKDRLEGEFSLDAVTHKTGVDKSTLVNLAREFAGAKAPLAVCGRGKGNRPVALSEVTAVQVLNALVGGINNTGGVWTVPAPDYIIWPDPVLDDTAGRGIRQARVDGAGGNGFPETRHLLNRLAEQIGSGKGDPIEALLVYGANPCYTLSGSHAFREALGAIPLVVSLSSYMDETAALADYILPDHTYLESFREVPVPAGYPKPMIGLVKPAVAPLFDTRHAGDTLMALAGAIGGTVADAFPWDNYEACLVETLGAGWESLMAYGYWVDTHYYPGRDAEAFDTPSGKFVFPSDLPMDAVGIAGDEKDFPLILVPYDSMRLASASIANPPFMTKTVAETVLKGNDACVEINPETADSLDLSEGRFAQLQTPGGSVRVRVHLSQRVGPGVIALATGLGHTAYDAFISGKGVNYNALAVQVVDPASGFDAAWGVRAKLTKA